MSTKAPSHDADVAWESFGSGQTVQNLEEESVRGTAVQKLETVEPMKTTNNNSLDLHFLSKESIVQEKEADKLHAQQNQLWFQSRLMIVDLQNTEHPLTKVID